jgi:hypothetical protein
MLIASCGRMDRAADPTSAFSQLLKRQLGEGAKSIQFEILKDSTNPEWARFNALDGIVYIEANTVSSAATALNQVIRQNQAGQFDWYEKVLRLPGYWPESGPDSIKSLIPYRWVGNTEWFNSETASWSWNEWEYFLDMMVLNGYNTLLLTEGIELIWSSVWDAFGLKDHYVNGSNVNAFPYLESTDNEFALRLSGKRNYFHKKLELHRKIARRARDLGIHVVIPAFEGRVSRQFRTKFPSAAYSSVLDEKSGMLMDFLEYSDPLYLSIQSRYFQIYEEMAGPLEYTWLAPFRFAPPSVFGVNKKKMLELAGTRIMESFNFKGKTPMLFLQSDFIATHRDFWDKEHLAAFFKDIPPYRCLLVYKENHGNTIREIRSNLPSGHSLNSILNIDREGEVIVDLDEALRRFQANLEAKIQAVMVTGSTFSSCESDILAFQYVGALAWELVEDGQQYFESTCNTRYGACDPGLLLAFQLARKSNSNLINNRIYRITGMKRFLFQLPPDPAWATFRHPESAVSSIHLTGRYYFSFLESHVDNPLFLKDFYDVTNLSLGIEIDRLLAEALAAYLLQNSSASDSLFLLAFERIELLERTRIFSGYKGIDGFFHSFRALESDKRLSTMLFDRFIRRDSYVRERQQNYIVPTSLIPAATSFHLSSWMELYSYLASHKIYFEESFKNQLLRVQQEWIEDYEPDSKKQSVDLKEIIFGLRNHYDIISN